MAKTEPKPNPRCSKCNNTYGRHGKSPDGVNLGKWIPCPECRPAR